MSFERRVALAGSRVAGAAGAVCEDLDAAARVDPEAVEAVYRDTPLFASRTDRVVDRTCRVMLAVFPLAASGIVAYAVLVRGVDPAFALVIGLFTVAAILVGGYGNLLDLRDRQERDRQERAMEKIRALVDADAARVRNPVARYAWLIVEAAPERLADLGADPTVLARVAEISEQAAAVVTDLRAEEGRWAPLPYGAWMASSVPDRHPLVTTLVEMAAEVTALADEQRLASAAGDPTAVPDGVFAETPASALRWEMTRGRSSSPTPSRVAG